MAWKSTSKSFSSHLNVDYHMLKFSLQSSVSWVEASQSISFELIKVKVKLSWHSFTQRGRKKSETQWPVLHFSFQSPPLKYHFPNRCDVEKKCERFVIFVAILILLHVLFVPDFCCLQHPMWRPIWQSEEEHEQSILDFKLINAFNSLVFSPCSLKFWNSFWLEINTNINKAAEANFTCPPSGPPNLGPFSLSQKQNLISCPRLPFLVFFPVLQGLNR